MSKNRTVEAQNRASTMRAPEPLTLEQLRGMRGKWVWISAPDSPMAPVEVCGWAYVGERYVFTYQEYENDLVVRVSYNLCDYGAWVAYAYQPDYSSKDAKMVPLTLQQLNGMEEPTPVWWGVMGEWCLARRGMITAPSGRIHDVIELSGLFYSYPPARIDREAWEPCWTCKNDLCRTCKSAGVDSMGDPCYKCNHEEALSEYEPSNFCPVCGRPLTPEAWAILERRLRGCMG